MTYLLDFHSNEIF